MIPTAKWIERKFAFDLPVWMFLNILERLRGTPARVEERVASLPRDILTVRPAQGWSIQEHVGHLWSVETLHYGRLEDYDAGLPVLRSADMENRRTVEARYNNQPIRDVLSGFRKARLEGMDDTAARRTALHPRLNQPMRVLDMMYFIAEHDDHHLARITELKLALTGKP